jgi:hypothetical protein
MWLLFAVALAVDPSTMRQEDIVNALFEEAAPQTTSEWVTDPGRPDSLLSTLNQEAGVDASDDTNVTLPDVLKSTAPSPAVQRAEAALTRDADMPVKDFIEEASHPNPKLDAAIAKAHSQAPTHPLQLESAEPDQLDDAIDHIGDDLGLE